MTDLQTSLLIIGGAIVASVVFYNKWQEYKTQKSVVRAFSDLHDDVLMTAAQSVATTSSERKEPTFSTEDELAASFAVGDDDRVAPEFHVPQEDSLPVEEEGVLPIDTLLDCVIPLDLATPVRGEKILPLIQPIGLIGNKSVHYIGQRQGGGWEEINYGGIYTAVQAGIQFAHAQSALNELEYSEFITRLRHVADTLDAEIDVPDMMEVIAQARSLYQFISEHDVQLSVNVRSKSAPWAVGTLLAALERQGFDARSDGRLIMSDGEGGILFSLSTNTPLSEQTTSRLTLLLNVPCVAASRKGFEAVAACAKSLAVRLGGTVVDDGDQPITPEALQAISTQLAEFYNEMDRAEIPVGSIRAMRLFN